MAKENVTDTGPGSLPAKKGTDPATGWPLEPKYFCANETAKGNDFGAFLRSAAGRELLGIKLCHLRLAAGPMLCLYQPGDCPFYGRYPEMSENGR